VKVEYILLKEAILNNNCPECYAKESLLLSFKQKKLLSKFYVKTKGEVIEHMECKKCETTIFPGRWTDDIERVYNYHKKTIDIQPTRIRFKGIFYLITVLVVIAIIVLYLFLNHPEIF